MYKKEEKNSEQIQKQYSKIMKQSSMQILLIPLLALVLIAGAITDSQIIFTIGITPILLYMLWFRVMVYRCPKCGHPFNQYQIYTYECKHCNTKFK